ncbi:penicillin-binding protein 2 [candidate division WWE3 bacterium]|uniref:Penicillin-binding protein 2 n=1 Tax=candidate division WWE3 bacterium TaxID=2053526 RepID=A0A955RS29_UNCKA|nr:penicillin-binding protein 2 [candidate division WWE3 bacterium]
MIIDHGEYSVLAMRQHTAERQLSADRGQIFSSDGFPLVLNAPSYLLFAVPLEMDDKDAVVEVVKDLVVNEIKAADVKRDKEDDLLKFEDDEKYPLTWPIIYRNAKRTLLDYEDWEKDLSDQVGEQLESLLSDDANQFVQLVADLDQSQKDTIEALEIPGVYFQQAYKRLYPESEMAAPVLGFVGKTSLGEDQGYFGLEGYYNGYLSGQVGYELIERDVEGKRIPFGNSKLNTPSHGKDIVVTIKREMQYLLDKKLNEGVKKYGAKSGTAILIDPYSGAIWAMSSSPSFNPQYWTEELNGEGDVSRITQFRNAAVGSNYEPGSVMKPVTMAMAINEDLVTPNTIYHDDGPVVYNGFPVRTWDNKYHGEITMTQILQLSDNTGAAWVGHQVGFEKFERYVNDFRFGQLLGIDLQGEEAGIVRDSSTWRDIDLANMSFGQGISVTPLQITAAFTTLINGGFVYKPYIVEEIKVSDDKVVQTQPTILSHPITDETSEQIRYMLKKVVTDGEFKWFVKQSGMDIYSVGGKTGTAQIPIDGEYDPHKTNTTFIGFGPVEDPKFVMYMMLSEPTTSTYSADTVVPMWMETARELMNYFSIRPEI